MKKTLQIAAITFATAGLPASTLAATVIDTTGPGSTNTVDQSNQSNVSQTNDNQIGVTNSNQQNAMSGNVESGGNTSGSWGDGSWGSLDPNNWQSSNRPFSSWWSALMQDLGSTSMSGWGNNSSWHPAGDNWQTNWANWDPMMWQAQGSTYSNWYMQVLPYLSSHYNDLQSGWGGNGSGNTMSGDASSGAAANANSTTTGVNVRNTSADAATLGALLSMNTEPSDVMIGTTGPDSYNAVTMDNSTNVDTTNLNDIFVDNFNDQSAMSGDVTSSRNTVSGNASSGNATNSNQTGTMIGLEY